MATDQQKTSTITFAVSPRTYRWWLGFRIDQQLRGIRLTDQKIGNEGLFGSLICWLKEQPPDIQNEVIDEGLELYKKSL